MIERNLTSGQYTICPQGVTVHTNCLVDEAALTSLSSSSSVIGCEKMSTERQLCKHTNRDTIIQTTERYIQEAHGITGTGFQAK